MIAASDAREVRAVLHDPHLAMDTWPDTKLSPGSVMTNMLTHLKQDRRYAAMPGRGSSIGVPALCHLRE